VSLVQRLNVARLELFNEYSEERLAAEIVLMDNRFILELENEALLEEERTLILATWEQERDNLRAQFSEKRKSREDSEAKRAAALQKQGAKQMQKGTAQGMDAIGSLFGMQKEAGIAKATIGMYEAAQTTWAQWGMPWGIPMVAAVVAAGLANINAIRSQGFAQGGVASMVGGRSMGIDSTIASVQPGEAVLNREVVNQLTSRGSGGGADVTLSLEGDVWGAIADNLSMRARNGTVRLTASSLSSGRSRR